ncbi:hypothetical protein HR060_14665 [Catenovulum sp. SM1970]|uniref:hypothetical protein n=1 Tax=Marinifaba aquimaris TaxID=2741323 RepID=UPI001571BC5E|nr:hypothetical protein [Marinifaba aquimaris]NTS78099.1 hypothetical protein [Marinifaba aquimaris]
MSEENALDIKNFNMLGTKLKTASLTYCDWNVFLFISLNKIFKRPASRAGFFCLKKMRLMKKTSICMELS